MQDYLTIEARFWVKANVLEDRDACWLWHAAKNKQGYGKFNFQRRNCFAHRIAYAIYHGIKLSDISDCILHTCDAPACINPHHLREGSRVENVADMVIKQRQSKGEQHSRAKFSEAKMREVIALAESKQCSQRELASIYGIRDDYLSKILRGRAWKHVTAASPPLLH